MTPPSAARARALLPGYLPRPYSATPLATTTERLFLNRFGTGFSLDALRQLRGSGGPMPWLRAQLRPGSVPETTTRMAQIDSWYPHLRDSAGTAWNNNRTGVHGQWEYAHDLGDWTLLRRIYSCRQVQETMTGFWSDLLHINVLHDLAWVHRFSYDQTMRRYALGRFDDLLVACSLHPSMRLYLNNWLSVRGATNENQGRELLELHTATRAAGYSEQIVQASAALLTGYTIDWGGTYGPVYDPSRHVLGKQTVLGFTTANAQPDGQAATVAYLRYLARHPATAQHIASRLATVFVSDTPSPGLVGYLAGVFRNSGTNIATTLLALAGTSEFRGSTGRKVRGPYADLVATARVLRTDVKAPTGPDSWATQANYLHGAEPLYSWPRPDGAPVTNQAWCSASRMFGSFDMHHNQSGGWWPTKDVAYRPPVSWLPKPSMRFDQYVDHLCRTLLGRGSTSRLLDVACLAANEPPSTIVTTTSQYADWKFSIVAAALLDTPEHMST